jgi:hypothetical protein
MSADIWANIDIALHAHSPELGLALQAMVRDITPILTGALLEDITSEPNTAPSGLTGGESDLVWVYAADVAQQAFWHRYYAPYQEGGVLGLPTYTNPPREMFYITATTDGLDATVMWAMDYIGEALRLSTLGGGAGFSVPFGIGLIRP